jgi:hypothetical protein
MSRPDRPSERVRQRLPDISGDNRGRLGVPCRSNHWRQNDADADEINNDDQGEQESHLPHPYVVQPTTSMEREGRRLCSIHQGPGERFPRARVACIICAQTLQLIYDARAAIASLHAALKHGGVLLATMPGISQVQSETGEVHWSFTRASAARMFGDVFGKEHVAAESHGNVFAAVCMLHGVAAQEAPQEKLIYQDDAYPVIVAVRAVKGAA